MRPFDTTSPAAFVGRVAAALLVVGCSPAGRPADHAAASPVLARGEPLILQEYDGEHRLRRPPPGALSTLGAPFILKIDRRNGGAPEFVMLAEDIPPGQAIALHHHPHSDEILFIHAGTGLASLGGRQAVVTSGATIYMPRNTVVGLRNTGTEPLKIIGIFSRPGFEGYLREISVPEGQTPAPLTVDELEAIRSRHLGTVMYERARPD